MTFQSGPAKGSYSAAQPSSLYRGVERISKLALICGGWAYFGITALVVFDIIARRTLNLSTGATTELTGYLMAAGMALGLAGTLMERGHVRIDVLVQMLPPRLRLAFNTLALIALLVTSSFLAWGAVTLALESFELGAADTSALHLPLVVPQGIWAAGLALLVLAALAVTARVLSLGLRGEIGAANSMVVARNDMDEAEETLRALGQEENAEKLAASVTEFQTSEGLRK